MTQPAKANEPSMEEILASIRRIIADDDAGKSPPQAPEAAKPVASAGAPDVPPPIEAVAPAAPKPNPVAEVVAQPAIENIEANEPPADILELTESMTAPVPRPMPDPVPQFRTIDGSSDVSFDEDAEKPAPRAIREPPAPLISHETSAAVDSAFNTLAQTVLVHNARTLEDLVREMLRPMLKSWLDENLPSLVERLVRAEIERVSRGR